MYPVQHSKYGPNLSEPCEDPSLQAKRIKIMNLLLMGGWFVYFGWFGFFLMFGVPEKYLRDPDSVPSFCH